MLLCKHCIEDYKNKGYVVLLENDDIYLEQEESEEFNVTCDNCGDVDSLYHCKVYVEIKE